MDDAQLVAVLNDHRTESEEFWMRVAELADDRLRQADFVRLRADWQAKLDTGEYFVKWQVLHTQDCRVAQEGIEISLTNLAVGQGRGGPWVELIHQSEFNNHGGRRCKLCAPLPTEEPHGQVRSK